MKRFLVCAVVALLPFAVMTGARAATLVNEDGEAYDFSIIDEAGQIDFSIEGGQTLEELCEEKCKLVIEGVGEFEVNKTDTVYIKAGKAEKRS